MKEIFKLKKIFIEIKSRHELLCLKYSIIARNMQEKFIDSFRHCYCLMVLSEKFFESLENVYFENFCRSA